jgi:hypothetical protein
MISSRDSFGKWHFPRKRDRLNNDSVVAYTKISVVAVNEIF